MTIEWTLRARFELSKLHDYIEADNPAAAEAQVRLILHSVALLADFPERGKAGRIYGTREMVVPGTSYIVVYSIEKDRIWLLAVLHGAQRWPADF